MYVVSEGNSGKTPIREIKEKHERTHTGRQVMYGREAVQRQSEADVEGVGLLDEGPTGHPAGAGVAGRAKDRRDLVPSPQYMGAGVPTRGQSEVVAASSLGNVLQALRLAPSHLLSQSINQRVSSGGLPGIPPARDLGASTRFLTKLGWAERLRCMRIRLTPTAKLEQASTTTTQLEINNLAIINDTAYCPRTHILYELRGISSNETPYSTPSTPIKYPTQWVTSCIENFEGIATEGGDDYATLKKLQRQLEYIQLQEEYIKDEQRSLKRELVRAQEEIKRIQSVPLVIGQFMEAIDQNTGIVQSSTGSNYVVRILSTLDREKLKPSSSVALHRHSNALVDILPPEADSSIAMLGADEKPDVTYADVGGLDMQKQEIREAVELPLTHFDLYKQIGIDPPRGVLLYGPPGTGKTMLVKAVANSTTANFIRVVGSEFVQKYLGEGPRMVRDVFRMARENAPAIIFIDEIDAIATKRFDAQTGADREVQRILLELLNQMDGFDQTANVKVIMATNRADTLDPALLRPGRLDRKIEFPSLRDRRERRLIFSTIASKMSLAPEVDMDSLIVRNDPLSGAVIAAIMQEAGLRAVRKNRYNIIQSDLEDAYSSQVKGTSDENKQKAQAETAHRGGNEQSSLPGWQCNVTKGTAGKARDRLYKASGSETWRRVVQYNTLDKEVALPPLCFNLVFKPISLVCWEMRARDCDLKECFPLSMNFRQYHQRPLSMRCSSTDLINQGFCLRPLATIVGSRRAEVQIAPERFIKQKLERNPECEPSGMTKKSEGRSLVIGRRASGAKRQTHTHTPGLHSVSAENVRFPSNRMAGRLEQNLPYRKEEGEGEEGPLDKSNLIGTKHYITYHLSFSILLPYQSAYM
ncbi:26S proteasome subunit P45 family protein [Colletotrichum lupini]|uniref:26S proteasome regulatory subunit 6B homolog n=1 Tax=Colletotrichum lupini TaxID=145971 RepID=A0A9Q8SPF3_9PEZI|nr:26S proteasome subunit P45 family protein [Colletotrichum lupini]UQC81058.1 26S proteasome subunit P45 family protein [Colletotrichum lupini]